MQFFRKACRYDPHNVSTVLDLSCWIDFAKENLDTQCISHEYLALCIFKAKVILFRRSKKGHLIGFWIFKKCFNLLYISEKSILHRLKSKNFHLAELLINLKAIHNILVNYNARKKTLWFKIRGGHPLRSILLKFLILYLFLSNRLKFDHCFLVCHWKFLEECSLVKY